MEKAEFSVGFLNLLGRLGEWGEKMWVRSMSGKGCERFNTDLFY
jgi:hypothetical protein